MKNIFFLLLFSIFSIHGMAEETAAASAAASEAEESAQEDSWEKMLSCTHLNDEIKAHHMKILMAVKKELEVAHSSGVVRSLAEKFVKRSDHGYWVVLNENEMEAWESLSSGLKDLFIDKDRIMSEKDFSKLREIQGLRDGAEDWFVNVRTVYVRLLLKKKTTSDEDRLRDICYKADQAGVSAYLHARWGSDGRYVFDISERELAEI